MLPFLFDINLPPQTPDHLKCRARQIRAEIRVLENSKTTTGTLFLLGLVINTAILIVLNIASPDGRLPSTTLAGGGLVMLTLACTTLALGLSFQEQIQTRQRALRKLNPVTSDRDLARTLFLVSDPKIRQYLKQISTQDRVPTIEEALALLSWHKTHNPRSASTRQESHAHDRF